MASWCNVHEGGLSAERDMGELVYTLPRFDVVKVLIERKILDSLRSKRFEASYTRGVAMESDA